MQSSLVALSLGSAFCFALALVLTQFGLRSTAPLAGASTSVPTTALLFLLISPLTIDWTSWTPNSVALFALVGLLFPAAVTFLTFASNRHLGPNLTGALGNLTPLFAVGIAILLLGELPRPGQIAGCLAVCIGVLWLALERSTTHSSATIWLMLMPLGAALLRGIVQPVVKKGLLEWPNAFAAATIGYAVSAMIILAVRRGLAPKVGMQLSEGRLWFVVVGLCNGLAVLALYSALSRGPVTIVAPLVATYPLATLLLNRLIHADRSLSLASAAGVIITVAGIAALLVF
jgi:drug/metabolite transporter (DMT)-like permease